MNCCCAPTIPDHSPINPRSFLFAHQNFAGSAILGWPDIALLFEQIDQLGGFAIANP
jgi:hypothetical protein